MFWGKVHQKDFYIFHQEQDLYHVVGYNMQFWYQVTLLHPTRHIPLTLEIFSLLSKLVTCILSVIHGLMVHPFGTTQEIGWIYQQLSQQSEFRPKYLCIWLDHWFFCMFFNAKWKAVLQGHQQGSIVQRLCLLHFC